MRAALKFPENYDSRYPSSMKRLSLRSALFASLIATSLLLGPADTSAQQGHPSIVFTQLLVGHEANGQLGVMYRVDRTSLQQLQALHPTIHVEVRDDSAQGAPLRAEVELAESGLFSLPTQAHAHVRISVKTQNGGTLAIRVGDSAGPFTTISTHSRWVGQLPASHRSAR